MVEDNNKRLIDISKENESIKKAFVAVKNELDEHREAINDTSIEIESNYEFLFELDKKMNKIEEKLDEVMFFMKEFTGRDKLKEPLYLSKLEQKIFLKLYTTENHSLSSSEIADGLRVSDLIVGACIKSLIKKNLPVFTERVGTELVYRLDPHFREIQAKRGIVKLDQTLMQEWV